MMQARKETVQNRGALQSENSEYQQLIANPRACGRILREPRDKKAQEHAQHIKDGNMLDLDFTDREFVRNIYKALRLSLINLNQMATAWFLYQSYPLFQTRGITQHRFDEEGPYDFRSISYMTAESERQFFAELEQLPAEEQCYYSINVSRKCAVTFLYEGLRDGSPPIYIRSPQFCVLLKKYIESTNLAGKEFYCKLVDELSSSNSFISESAKMKLITLIELVEPDLVDFLHGRYKATEVRDRLSPLFFIHLLKTVEQIPNFAISPDYDPSSRKSPLLCFILPSISAFSALQKSVHGKDMTHPFFTVGKFAPQFIDELDEAPEGEVKTQSQRPIELTHPDIEANVTPHNLHVHNFLIAWHDLYHAWRCGANPLKPFIRFLKDLLINEKGFKMSKVLWELADNDFSAGRLIREKAIRAPDAPIDPIHFYAIFLKIPTKFWSKLESRDDNLLLIADMIIRREEWKKFMGDYPEKKLRNQIGASQFLSAFSKMKKIIDADQNKDKHSLTYYVLAYRLMGYRLGLELSRLMDRYIDLNEIFKWNRNSGLYIKSEYSDLKIRRIEKMAPKQLFNELMRILETPANNRDFTSELQELRRKEKMSYLQIWRQEHPRATYIGSNIFLSLTAMFLLYIAIVLLCDAKNARDAERLVFKRP